jgi:hypothetical protein
MPVTDAKLEYSQLLEQARASVLDWLREAHRNPLFLESEDSPQPLKPADSRIIDRFMSWVAPAGFELTTQETADGLFEIHWKHHGYDFVGFRQPPAGKTLDEAKILACSALLQNEWCRSRLP